MVVSGGNDNAVKFWTAEAEERSLKIRLFYNSQDNNYDILIKAWAIDKFIIKNKRYSFGVKRKSDRR